MALYKFRIIIIIIINAVCFIMMIWTKRCRHIRTQRRWKDVHFAKKYTESLTNAL